MRGKKIGEMSGKFSQLCGGNEQLLGRKLGDWLCQLQLGTGSFGIVHVWRNTVTEETVALKKCRFASEVMMSEKVRNIVVTINPSFP